MNSVFNRPVNLNGTELIAELAGEGLIVSKIIDNSDGTIEFLVDDFEAAKKIVANHNGTIKAPEPTIEEKLQSVGLSIDDLRTALGL